MSTRRSQHPHALVIAAWPTLRRVGSSRFGIIGEVRLYSNGTGVWRSLVARFVRDEEAVGSNPATPTVSRRDRLVPATFVIPGRGASRRAGCRWRGRGGCPWHGRGGAAGARRARCCGAGWREGVGPGLATAETTAQGPLHPLRGAAPEQKGCNAYGSGAAHPITRTNAESARRPPARRRYIKEQNVLVLWRPSGVLVGENQQ